MYYIMSVGEATQVVHVANNITSFIPKSESNVDWQAYQEWLAEGNTPEPWPPAE